MGFKRPWVQVPPLGPLSVAIDIANIDNIDYMNFKKFKKFIAKYSKFKILFISISFLLDLS